MKSYFTETHRRTLGGQYCFQRFFHRESIKALVKAADSTSWRLCISASGRRFPRSTFFFFFFLKNEDLIVDLAKVRNIFLLSPCVPVYVILLVVSLLDRLISILVVKWC